MIHQFQLFIPFQIHDFSLNLIKYLSTKLYKIKWYIIQFGTNFLECNKHLLLFKPKYLFNSYTRPALFMWY